MYIVFDTETTGKIKNIKIHPSKKIGYPHIVQLAWILCYRTSYIKKNYIIYPNGYTIPKESSDIHHITDEIALKQGLPLKDVLLEFKEDINKANFLVAHNAEFDARIIASECYRCGLDDFMTTKTIICTMKSTTNLCQLKGKYGYKYPQLKELYFYLFRKYPSEDKLHNAMEDTLLTKKCWDKLSRRYKDIQWVVSYSQ